VFVDYGARQRLNEYFLNSLYFIILQNSMPKSAFSALVRDLRHRWILGAAASAASINNSEESLCTTHIIKFY
ncbi:MAG: hypothetical protein ACXW0T_10240, partial [Methylobacter sp.]